jgi:catechol 2,3-dioxygenase-like lactoylglutathione lyase family enzyme
MNRRWMLSGLLALLIAIAGSRLQAVVPPDIDSTVTMFYYKDLAVVAPFYEKTLGLTKTLDLGWCKLYRVSPTSYVGLIDERRGFHKVARAKPAMLSIVTTNVDSWHERMVAAGVHIVKPLKPLTELPTPGMAPVRGFVVRDPGGYTVEFFAWREDPRSREVRGLTPAAP